MRRNNVLKEFNNSKEIVVRKLLDSHWNSSNRDIIYDTLRFELYFAILLHQFKSTRLKLYCTEIR